MDSHHQTPDQALGHSARSLTQDEYDRVNSDKTEIDAKKNWDKFYLRNQTNFFKNRNWTKREFEELELDRMSDVSEKPVLLELGSGVGNFLFPLIEEGTNFYIFACDFSPRAVDFIKSNPLYDEEKCKAFVADIADDKFDRLFNQISGNKLVDVVSLIFVLSAISPDKMKNVLTNCYKVLKPSGKVILRDYGLYDHTQIRFKPESKISDNFYTRIDGTRSYFFSTEFLSRLGRSVGFEVVDNRYISRETKNVKEAICVPRIFVQCKLLKPIGSST